MKYGEGCESERHVEGGRVKVGAESDVLGKEVIYLCGNNVRKNAAKWPNQDFYMPSLKEAHQNTAEEQ